jgi:hypothetical protein
MGPGAASIVARRGVPWPRAEVPEIRVFRRAYRSWKPGPGGEPGPASAFGQARGGGRALVAVLGPDTSEPGPPGPGPVASIAGDLRRWPSGPPAGDAACRYRRSAAERPTRCRESTGCRRSRRLESTSWLPFRPAAMTGVPAIRRCDSDRPAASPQLAQQARGQQTALGTTCGNHRADYPRHLRASPGMISASVRASHARDGVRNRSLCVVQVSRADLRRPARWAGPSAGTRPRIFAHEALRLTCSQCGSAAWTGHR